MLYQICDYVTLHTSSMLYYSFVCIVGVDYGVIVWGTASQNQLHEINLRMNSIVHAITWNKKFSLVTHLYKKLNYLKLNHICNLELLSLCIKFAIMNWLFRFNNELKAVNHPANDGGVLLLKLNYNF